MQVQDIEEARKLLSISLDDLPTALQEATKAQIGLAQQAAIRSISRTTLAMLSDDEGYRYELITKEMSRRGFQSFAGCLAGLEADELDQIIEELIPMQERATTYQDGYTKRLP